MASLGTSLPLTPPLHFLTSCLVPASQLPPGTGCEFKTQGTLATPFVGVTWRAGLGAKNSGTLQVGPNTCFPEPLFLCNFMLVLTEAALCEPSSSPPLHAAACRLVT